MTSITSQQISRPGRDTRLRRWSTAIGLTAMAAGAAVTAGAFMPWVETFGGLIGIPGVRGSNGRILAAAGIIITAAGLYHVFRGGAPARWLIGIGGAGCLGFSGYLLIQLAASTRNLGSDPMVIARGGPGLWVTAAGSLAAFVTLFLPPSSQTAFRRHDTGRGILARGADREPAGFSRGLQIALGVLWLLDAALQYQPYMFSKAFATQMLAPAAMGNPALIASPAMFLTRLVSHQPAVWNSAFATIQLALAAGLLWRRTATAALAGTIGWSLSVWWLGEGLGGLLTGTATPLTGAPGAALLYAMIAVLAWPPHSADQVPGRRTAANPARTGWDRLGWSALWGGFAYLVIRAPSRGPQGLHDTIAGLAAGEPGWLAAIDRTAAAAASHATALTAVSAVLFILIAAGIWHPATIRAAAILALPVAVAIWVAGENFGGIFTGHGTDPNTGPLLILVAAALWKREGPSIRSVRRSAIEPRSAAAMARKSRTYARTVKLSRGHGA